MGVAFRWNGELFYSDFQLVARADQHSEAGSFLPGAYVCTYWYPFDT